MERFLSEEPGAAVPLRSRSPGQGRAGAKRSPIAKRVSSRHGASSSGAGSGGSEAEPDSEAGAAAVPAPFPPPRPGDLNSGTESALKLLQNRKFVILEQNLRVFSYGLGDARSELGMTGRRFRVKPGMTMKGSE